MNQLERWQRLRRLRLLREARVHLHYAELLGFDDIHLFRLRRQLIQKARELGARLYVPNLSRLPKLPSSSDRNHDPL